MTTTITIASVKKRQNFPLFRVLQQSLARRRIQNAIKGGDRQ